MSPARRAALSVLADRIRDLLLENQRDLARQVGLSHSTPGERGSDPDAWPLSELLVMGERYPSIDEALAALLSAQPEPPRDADPERAARSLIGSMGGQIQRLIDRLDRDGLDARDLRETDTDLATLQAQLSQARAVIRAKRRGA